MKNYRLKYGEGYIDVPLFEKNVIKELLGNAANPLCDIQSALLESIQNPVESLCLAEFAKTGDKIAIIVSDLSRFWMRQDLVVPHLVDYLNNICQIPDPDIVLVIANGTHAGGSSQDLEKLVTKEVASRIEIVNHNCMADDLVYIGTTSRGTEVSVNPYVASRKVITLGACTHHVMAGFGGGRKSILPGVASAKAIRQNHAHALDPHAAQTNPLIGNAVLKGNPINEDMCEAVAFLQHLFTINLVMSPNMELAHIVSGDIIKSWEKACILADDMYTVPIEAEVDVIIAGAGGYPKDMSFYQGSKAIDNLQPALKIGGTFILIAQCKEGGGPAEYFDWLKPLKSGNLDEELRRNFTIPGYVFYLNCEQAKRYRMMLLSELNKKDAQEMGIEVYQSIEDLLSAAGLEDKKILVIPDGSVVIPKVVSKG
ncbi:MAG: nickel-dependent lactate racemase [Clostridia bacterium]|nr:nickel-dependent lactate racemase [Clostridia bacterium]